MKKKIVLAIRTIFAVAEFLGHSGVFNARVLLYLTAPLEEVDLSLVEDLRRSLGLE